MVSFDATYDTNKYSMAFVPLTGVDHHKSCITFGVGFIGKENTESFEWLLRTFLQAMGNYEPTCIITDQDPAMKAAIKLVLKHAQHRLCMWHIMGKVSEKISPELRQDKIFFEVINACVWNMDHETEEFEYEWRSIIVKYDLEHNEWFNYMFSIRELWIPAYFRDLFLGGIMRTTSRSESENNFFCNFTNPHVTLVEFFMRFESAMDSQRHKQDKLNYDSKHSLPELKTPLPLERHASKVYTHTIFYMFQKEITTSCFYCGIVDITKEHDRETVVVKDYARSKTYIVLFNAQDHLITCSCKLFERLGILCRHAVCVLKSRDVKEIPSSYVLSRWTKDAPKKPIFDMDDNLLEECRQMNTKKNLLCECWSEIYNCVALAERNEEDLINLLEILKGFSKTMLERNSSEKQMTKVQEMEFFVGPSATSDLNILNPKQSSNKGSGKRRKGEKEKAMEQQQKTKRNCRACGAYDYHDSRTCPTKKAS